MAKFTSKVLLELITIILKYEKSSVEMQFRNKVRCFFFFIAGNYYQSITCRVYHNANEYLTLQLMYTIQATTPECIC